LDLSGFGGEISQNFQGWGLDQGDREFEGGESRVSLGERGVNPTLGRLIVGVLSALVSGRDKRDRENVPVSIMTAEV